MFHCQRLLDDTVGDFEAKSNLQITCTPGRLTAGTYKSPMLERKMIKTFHLHDYGTKPPGNNVPAVNLQGYCYLLDLWETVESTSPSVERVLQVISLLGA